MTELNGIEFGPCWDAAGVRGFYGDGYDFHWPFLLKTPWSNTLRRSAFATKTVVVDKRAGNMQLDPQRNYEPVIRFPRVPSCIWIDPFRKLILNAVGLSCPGAEIILIELAARIRKNSAFFLQPFMVSFAAVKPTRAERADEARRFVRLWKKIMDPVLLENPSVKVGLQFNDSCPNTGEEPHEETAERREMLQILKSLGIPLILKLNALTPVTAAKDAEDLCDAFCVSNAIPFGRLAEALPHIRWDRIFPYGSPLKQFGGGGVSGDFIFPLVAKWTWDARHKVVLTKPLNIGGGIDRPGKVDILVGAGLRRRFDSIFIGSMLMNPLTRPLATPTINRAHVLLN